MELTTVERVLEFLHDEGEVGDLNLLEQLVAKISAQIETECGRIFGKADYTEKYDGPGTDTLILNQYPVNSVSSLKENDSEISSGDYEIYADAGMIRLPAGIFSEGVRNIEVSYSAGYETIPEDLELACVMMIIAEYQSSHTDVETPEGEDVGDKINRNREEAEKIIAKYRKVQC